METIFITLIFVIILFQVISAVREMKSDNKEKAFTKSSIHLLIAVFFSILLSIGIALKAEIPASSGHGGFLYIIAPLIFGILIFVIYLAFLRISPEWKLFSGLISILMNIGIGFYFMFTDL